MTTTTFRTRCGVTVQAIAEGDLLTIAPLTACCGAAVTGTTSGVACKGCGSAQAAAMGGAPHAAIIAAVTAAGCPCPDACADQVLWVVESAATPRA